MEFWPESQDHLPLYAKFGTVPGRNCTPEYHNRHQATHYPLYYGEQQDQGRESCYWTVPGSRTGGTLQEYTNWTEQDLPAPPSSYFPFILEHQTQQHQDRNREWTASQRTTREYERGLLREGWQSRWEPCSPVQYNREVSTKRSDSIYRELEAWAARYSHTLPRRRRVEAELRGSSQGLLETCRTPERHGRTGTDPRVAAIQQVRQSANIRESGVWDRGNKLQTPTYYPLQAPALDTSNIVDIKGKTGYQRRMFSHPPGYIAPPPYKNQHRCSPVAHHRDSSWEEQGKRHTYWSQPTLKKQNVSVELQYNSKEEKENFTSTDENKTCAEVEEMKLRREETGDLQASSPVSVLNAHSEHPTTLLLEQPQTTQADKNTKTNNQASAKIIEGRKFKLNKKTGRMTIFCLVSRIAGATEIPSLPLCISQSNIENTGLGGVSKGSLDTYDNQMSFADEVDFGVPILTEHSDTSDVTNLKDKEKETSLLIEGEMGGDNPSNRDETGNVSPGKTNLADVNSTNMSVKYPLWKEPSFTSGPETGSSSTCCFKLERESDGLHSQEGCKVHPINNEVQRLDIKKDTESEDNKGLLVIDTSCVVVKMELIPSPKKEQIQFFSYTAKNEHNGQEIQTSTPEPNILHVTNDQNTETESLEINENPANDPHSALIEKRSAKCESEVSSPCIPSSSVPETLEERAQRILGIPLYDGITERQPGGATSFPELHVEEREDEFKPFVPKNNFHDAVKEITGDKADKKWSRNQLEVGQTKDSLCLKDCNDVKEECEDFVGTQEQVMSKENSDSQLETDINISKELKLTEDDGFENTSEEGKTVDRQGDNQPAENDTSPHPFNPAKDPYKLTTFPYISEPNTNGIISQNPVSDTPENLAAQPETPFPNKPQKQIPKSIESSPTFTLHTELSPNPPPLNVTNATSKATATITLCSMDQERTTRMVKNEVFAKDVTKKPMSGQQSGNDQSEIPPRVEQRDFTAGQQMKQAHPADLLVQTLEIPKETAIDNVLQPQLKYVKAKETQREIGSPSDVLETTVSQNNMIDSHKQLEVNIKEKGFENGKDEDISHLKVTYLTKELTHIDADDNPAGLLEQTISQVNTTDCHAQTEIKMLQDTKPETEVLGLKCEVSPSTLDVLSPSTTLSPPYISHKSSIEPVFILEMDFVCPSEMNSDTADTAIPETTPPPLYLSSTEESLPFPSYFPSQSTLNLVSHCTTPAQDRGESDLPHKEESQYPKSLWDAVYRIRKHTAPDSDNEEEEVSELWDPESLGHDLGCPDVAVDFKSRKMVCDEARQREVLTEVRVGEVEMGQIQKNTCHEEPSGCAEDDTVSCSSTSSHSSGETVIVAEEGEAEVTTLDGETDSKTETDEEQEESCLSEEFKGEVENTTAEDVELTEIEQKRQ
ncbi:hypothetical protein Q8A73_005503 [Channa argus]|nr:hypothetical protein Q8A73_005503 [Channa argus]